jgi:hypothetical protein
MTHSPYALGSAVASSGMYAATSPSPMTAHRAKMSRI